MNAFGTSDRLSSRERVLTAIHHGQPDRVPINYSGNAGIHRRLCQHFGLVESDYEGLLQALGVDFRGIWAPYTGPVLHQPIPDRKVDPLWGIRTCWIEHGSGGYWDFCDFPLAQADVAAVDAWPMPDPAHFNYVQARQKAQTLRDQGWAVAVGGPGMGDNMNSGGFLRSYEQILLDLAAEEPAGLRLMDRRNDFQIALLERTLDACRGLVDLVWLGEDLGTQQGPLISMDTFRRHIRPRLQRFVDAAKTYDLPVMIHCCGSSSWAFEDFIAMGIKVVDTLQPEAHNMSPAYLKRTYGRRLACHGCISTAGPVEHGTLEEVRADVTSTLQTMMPGGGYLFAPTHCLQDDTPTENAVAMYQLAHTVGRYS